MIGTRLELMIPSTEQVLAVALELSREERAVVVQALLRSLDHAEDLLDADDRELRHAAIARSDEQFRAGGEFRRRWCSIA